VPLQSCPDPHATLNAAGGCDCDAPAYRTVGVPGLRPQGTSCVLTAAATTILTSYPETTASKASRKRLSR
jgi:hypothetical protein